MTVRRAPVEFAIQSNEYDAKQLVAETCKNWYLLAEQDGLYKLPLIPFPGSELFSEDTSSNVVRGLYSLNNVLYGVIDNKLRIYSSNGGYKDIGTLNTSEGRVGFMANDNQVFITDFFNGYVYQLVDTEIRKKGDFFKIENATSFIGDAKFVGSGINDMTTGGTYIGTNDRTYKVEIDSIGTPDTFKWSDDNGETYKSLNVAITGSDQLLNYGVTVTFQHTDGHADKDFWHFDVTRDDEFYPPIIPTYLSPYGIYPKKNTKRFYITAIDDFSIINALDYANTGLYPDNLIAGVVINGEVVFFCRTTTEFWYNVGNVDFPLQPRPNLLVNYGCLAPYSIAVAANNILIWLGRNRNGGRVVLAMENYQPIIISNNGLNSKLQEYEKVDDAFAYVIEWEGQTFYFLTLPSEDVTWVYHLELKRWYQRTTRYQPENLNPKEYVEGRYLGNCYAYHDEKYFVGDYRNGNIYKLSKKFYKDNDEYIICEATTAPLNINLDEVSIYSFRLVFQAATALTVGYGDDPQVMLQYSRDGGMSWKKELWRGMGKVGEYKRRVRWNKLSYSRDAVFRIRISDPIYRVLMGGVIELEDIKA